MPSPALARQPRDRPDHEAYKAPEDVEVEDEASADLLPAWSLGPELQPIRVGRIRPGERNNVAFNLEFAYKIPLAGKPWAAYVGAGPALNIYRFSDGRGRGRDDTEAGGGFNVLVGAEHDDGLFGEFKIGVSDSPDLKLMVGYSLR